MTQTLDWNDVRYFLETARAGRMSRAGRRLGVSHTTVARHVAGIEALLRTRLFEPDTDGLSLTEAGRALVPLAEEMEARADRICDLLQRPGGLSGRVRVGAPDGFGNAVLSRLLPGIGVTIANSLASLLAAKLSRSDEFEADAYASALLVKAGIGTAPQKSLFRKLDALTGSGTSPVPAWFMSHPKVDDRIAAIEANEAKWGISGG